MITSKMFWTETDAWTFLIWLYLLMTTIFFCSFDQRGTKSIQNRKFFLVLVRWRFGFLVVSTRLELTTAWETIRGQSQNSQHIATLDYRPADLCTSRRLYCTRVPSKPHQSRELENGRLPLKNSSSKIVQRISCASWSIYSIKACLRKKLKLLNTMISPLQRHFLNQSNRPFDGKSDRTNP